VETVLPAGDDDPRMNVLLGIGGTDDSFRALERVVDRAAEAGDDLTVAVLANPESERTPDAVEERARSVLADSPLAVHEEAGCGEGTATVRNLDGEPGPQLVELSEREEFDQIALGGGERSPMGKIAVGHVAEYVLVNARVTVKLVR